MFRLVPMTVPLYLVVVIRTRTRSVFEPPRFARLGRFVFKAQKMGQPGGTRLAQVEEDYRDYAARSD